MGRDLFWQTESCPERLKDCKNHLKIKRKNLTAKAVKGRVKDRVAWKIFMIPNESCGQSIGGGYGGEE